MLHSLVQRAGYFIWHRLAERRGKFRRRFTDQIGFGDVRKQRRQAGYATRLGKTAGDPVNPLIA